MVATWLCFNQRDIRNLFWFRKIFFPPWQIRHAKEKALLHNSPAGWTLLMCEDPVVGAGQQSCEQEWKVGALLHTVMVSEWKRKSLEFGVIVLPANLPSTSYSWSFCNVFLRNSVSKFPIASNASTNTVMKSNQDVICIYSENKMWTCSRDQMSGLFYIWPQFSKYLEEQLATWNSFFASVGEEKLPLPTYVFWLDMHIKLTADRFTKEKHTNFVWY